jgi:hypothetical protein
MPGREFPFITGSVESGAGIEQGSMKKSWNEVSANG